MKSVTITHRRFHYFSVDSTSHVPGVTSTYIVGYPTCSERHATIGIQVSKEAGADCLYDNIVVKADRDGFGRG